MAALYVKLLLFSVCACAPAAGLKTGHSARQERLAAAIRAGVHSSPEDLQAYSFTQFVEEYHRAYQPDTPEWVHRAEVFEKRRQAAIDFQSQTDRTWSMGVNKFMDYTDEEYRQLLGYKGSRRHTGGLAMGTFLNANRGHRETEVALPDSYSAIKRESHAAQVVMDQGACGSCWAIAALNVLEARLENDGNLSLAAAKYLRRKGASDGLELKSDDLIHCTPNPRHCGGTGGCEGATVELAYAWVKEHGIELDGEEKVQRHRRRNDHCSAKHFNLGLTGYETLPSNKARPLLEAVVNGGPVAVTVDATNWASYSGGVFSDRDTKGDFTVNHAVTLTGYTKGSPSQSGYYHIKNSWGPNWGLKGFLYVEMKDDEDKWCGWDYKPKDGVACDGDPEQAWVCGTSGILYDSVVPMGLRLRNK